ncbi:exported protein of unknown function [Tenacibaculum sp. 190524A02b]|uniref:Lipoprotein n=1 Tax=Tenacibaculum vairaonense TaxID=3137860 RepID=A0ABP1F6I1_9FLAO
MKKVKQLLFLFFLAFISSCQNNDSIEVIQEIKNTNNLSTVNKSTKKNTKQLQKFGGPIRIDNDNFQTVNIVYLSNLSSSEKNSFRAQIMRNSNLSIDWYACPQDGNTEIWLIDGWLRYNDNQVQTTKVFILPPGTVGETELDDDISEPRHIYVKWKASKTACSINGLP